MFLKIVDARIFLCYNANEGGGDLYFIGIDPGANGGFAIMTEAGVFDVNPFDKKYLVKWMRVLGGLTCEKTACLEKVGAMPKQGVVSMFNFGKNAGYIEGVLDTVGINFQSVTPQEWKKEFGLISKKGTETKEKKQASIDKCKELFPDVSLRKTARCTTDSDGMAEALLIAEFCRRKFGNS